MGNMGSMGSMLVHNTTALGGSAVHGTADEKQHANGLPSCRHDGMPQLQVWSP